MTFNNDCPDAFKAVSSFLSAKLPYVMIDENNTANGNAKGIRVAETKNNSLKRIQSSNPLPIRSSMYTQRNCMIKKNIAIEKVIKKGPIKDLIMKISNFFKLQFIFRNVYIGLKV